MKCKLSIQEKLKDLRIERGLSLQELSEQTGLSRAALGNYETDDYKEITHKAIVILADFYGVTSDYLLGLTENREQHPFAVDELGLDDETVDLLKSGKLNVRLICEMIKHPEFINFLSDLEIYVDNLAGMQIRNMNTMIEQTRMRLQNNEIPDSDHYMKTLEAASINEDNYFNNLLGNDIVKIAKDLRDAHGKDTDTGDLKEDAYAKETFSEDALLEEIGLADGKITEIKVITGAGQEAFYARWSHSMSSSQVRP